MPTTCEPICNNNKLNARNYLCSRTSCATDYEDDSTHTEVTETQRKQTNSIVFMLGSFPTKFRAKSFHTDEKFLS